jgi:hypothetical protein
VIATDERFETFTENDDEWFSDIELRALDLEKELSEWRESRARELAESARRREREAAEAEFLRYRERELAEPGVRQEAPHRTAAFHRAEAFDRDEGGAGARPPRHREFLRATGGARGSNGSGSRHEGGRTASSRASSGPAVGHAWPISDEELDSANDRTQVLINRGRRTAPQRRSRNGKKIAIGSTAALVLVIILVATVFRKGASWPASVATVQSEITTACQNPNVVSEPSQVNFACAKDTNQILWVFSLMTSDNNPKYSDAKTGRKGLEPITSTQGGEIAWSLNLHHPYDPFNAVDSLAVAARAIDNIIGGATLTGSNGNPTVQPGLLSNPVNCARYTGSSAIISHAGFPSQCATPVTSAAGQAALVADVYQQWMVGATSVAAQDVAVLFENANNPGDPQVQAILKTLPSSK